MKVLGKGLSLSRILGGWGVAVGRRPWAVVVGSLLVAAALMSQLPQLRFDTSFESFLEPEHPIRTTLDHFRDEFGRSEPIVVAVRIPDRITDPVFLERLEALHHDLEARVPNLKRIRSLVNVRRTEARGDELHVGELLEDWPSTPAALELLERRVRATPLYRNYLVGDLDENGDGPIEWTALMLEAERFAADPSAQDAHFADAAVESRGRALTSDDDHAMVTVVREVLDAHRAPGFDFELAGSLVVGDVVGRSIKTDFARLLLMGIATIAALLFLALRSASSVALVLSVVLLSLAGSLGAMAAVGAPFGFGTQILPTFLLAAGVGYAVHVVSLFRHEYGVVSDRPRAVAGALRHAGAPIVLTGLTTIGGLLSFTATELAPVVQIGLFAPLGITLTLFFSLTLLPALLVLLPARATTRAARRAPGTVRLLTRSGLWATEHPELVLVVLAGVLSVSAVGITRLEPRHDTLRWLPESHPLRTATDLVDAELGGASVLELLIEANDGVDLRDPRLLQRIDALETKLLQLDGGRVEIGKVAGLHDVVKELNQSLHGDLEAHYAIPDDPQLVSQELLLFEMSGMDDIEQLVNGNFTTTRVSVRINRIDAFHTVPFSQRVLELARSELGEFASVELTGLYDLKAAVLVNVIDALESSYTIAIVVIGMLMLLMTGDFRIGLAAVIPNMTPVVVALGMMGLFGIPIGVYTLLVGSIVLGLAVDDTIHMAHSFVRYERETGDPVLAVRRTLETAGVAILFTSAALVCGFLIFSLATLSALLHFGIVAAVAIAAALIADVFVSPVLFCAVVRGRKREGWAARGDATLSRAV